MGKIVNRPKYVTDLGKMIVFPIPSALGAFTGYKLSYYLIQETNDALANKQLFYYTVSLFIFFLVFILPIRKTLFLVPTLYWFAVILLILVEFIGVTKLGAKRWIAIPFTDSTIQPSEIIKTYIYILFYRQFLPGIK